MKIKIRPLKTKFGNVAAQQMHLEIDGVEYFTSYESVIAKREDGQVTLDERYWNYSSTTGYYRNQWLGVNKEETRKRIESGEYLLADLN